jgi:hypothetical protein
MSEPLRRAGWGRAGPLEVTWSIAEGSKGRRWREVVRRDGAVVHALLYETDPARRFAHLELSIDGALLTLHPEGDGTLHGNRVSAHGIDHVRGIAFPAGSWVLIDRSPVAAAAVAWGSSGSAGAIIGVDATGAIHQVDASVHPSVRPAAAVDPRGVPVLDGATEWPLDE